MTLDWPSFALGATLAAVTWAIALWLGNRIGKRIAERAFQQFAPPPPGRGFEHAAVGAPTPSVTVAPPAPVETPRTTRGEGMQCFVCRGSGANKSGGPCKRCKGKGRT